MQTGYVDMNELADRATKVLHANKQSDDVGIAKEFRKFDRSNEFMHQLLENTKSAKTTTTVKNHIAKIEEAFGSTFGSKLGTSNRIYFSLEEVHLIFDQMLEMDLRYKENIPVPFRMSKAYVWLLTNLKGGTGKTSAVVYLAVAMALLYFQRPRILVLDLDPQGQVHDYFDGRVIDAETTPTVGQVVTGYKMAPAGLDHTEWLKSNVVRKSHIANIDYIPALPSDTQLERHLSKKYFNGESDFSCLKQLNEKIIDPLKSSYDIILMDSPPANNLTVHSGVFAADGIIVPAATKPMDSEPTLSYIRELSNKIEILKDELDYPGINSFWTLPGMHKDTRQSSRTVKRRFVKAFQDRLLPEIAEREGYLSASQTFKTMYDYATNDDAGTNQRSKIIEDWDRVAEPLLRYMERYDDLRVHSLKEEA